METLGELLFNARKKLNISLKEAQNITGCSDATISLLERDLRNPSFKVAIKLADSYSIPLEKMAECMKNKMVTK